LQLFSRSQFQVVLAVLFALPTLALAQTCTPYPAAPSTYLICLPPDAPANIDLVVFAHGYVAPTVPVGQIPLDQLSLQGVSIPALVNSLGFAFAVSSYPKNGLAIREGITDLENLVTFYKGLGHLPEHVYLVGASEGGLVTTKLVEQGGPVFSGGLALCGPIGDFPGQINHFGDVRVVFDYFFPGVLPPSPVWIPNSAIEEWDTMLAPAVAAAIAANPSALQQLYRVTGTPIDPTQPADAAIGNLWYNIFATDDAHTELGGQPFNNKGRLYFGSENDFRLNTHVERFSADPAALEQMREFYQTTGKLPAPLVTMHTTGDPIVPYWHEVLYGVKVLLKGSLGEYIHVPIVRYGHCNFEPPEVLLGFALLVARVSGQQLTNPEQALPTEEMRRQYRSLSGRKAAQ
jgi:hypothetical protein